MLNNNSQEEPTATEDEERITTTRREPDGGVSPGERDRGRRATPRLAALRKVGRSRRPWCA